MSACTIRSTLSSARVASSSANPATTKEKMRSPVDRSPTPSSAFAAMPPMPDLRARVPGSSLLTLAPSPNTTTTRKT